MKKFFGKAQQFGKSFMLPIAILPAAGLLLGIGGALSNPNTVNAYPILDQFLLQAIFTIMSSAGNIVFANLPVIFAVGVAIGLARSDKGTAGLAALIGYLVMNATINAILIISDKLATDSLSAVGQGVTLGIQTLESGVFGGIIVGIMAGLLHNRFNKIELPQFLGFFGGSRFVPIITSFSAIILGTVMYYVWPMIQNVIFNFGDIVNATGYIGTFFYGFILRMLGPFGLHHIFYLPFWQTGLGGALEIGGQLIQGTQNIFFAQLGDPTTTKFFEGTSRFMSGRFITMMFGLLGAAYAIYRTAKPEHKKVVGGLMLSAALTSFLTGITEPLEFSFLFIAPLLYVMHAIFDGLAFMLAHIFQITIGQTFSGGFIDFILFGVLQGQALTNWMYVIPIGIIWFFLYFFTFTFLIKKFNFKTPGREDKKAEDDTTVQTAQGSGEERPLAIIQALGGRDNLVDVDNCATRLRVTVKDGEMVNEAALQQTGSKGVIVKGEGVQVIYGPQVSVIKNEIEEELEK
ncbi:glucose-specific PTS transporter subunit IIBC [Oceanobacillus profundus]|uniref:glucose-specific PTS transporter subunit IIBC n=1 Tax=Oceanobacillus TaxID=182709 RepID=UPI000BA643A7|nr:glucose-specific PTS transporter subunit IIBC [Oceanobacillus profundus]MBR3121237.1 PTS transporter subunit EIIC [Oceanobacillus sp.]MCM3400347.1 glucose-specific PTS transporter subunit IIBC [Oceanobacillus profundus]MDO6451255.1 glucose-specific PTS transporter subunit IIBC [Oceanobacillus profundus]PAE30405.1 PTS glucose transporter subunit IIB [Paenibacillus sp. 7884-2]